MYGAKASKPNIDIGSAEAFEQVFNSSYNTLKILSEVTGTATMTASSEFTSDIVDVEITHNLGYSPLIMLYYKDPSSGRWLQGPSIIPGGNGASPLGYYISGTYVIFKTGYNPLTEFVLSFIYFRDSGQPASIDIDYKLFLLLEPRQDAWYD